MSYKLPKWIVLKSLVMLTPIHDGDNNYAAGQLQQFQLHNFMSTSFL